VSDWRPKLVFKLGFRGHVALNLQEKTPRVLDFVTQLSVLAEPFDPILAIGLQRIPQWLCQSPSTAASEISRPELRPGLMTDGRESLRLSPPASFGASIHSFGVQMITWNPSALRLQLAGMSIQPLP
jgi:hypothetical protein